MRPPQLSSVTWKSNYSIVSQFCETGSHSPLRRLLEPSTKLLDVNPGRGSESGVRVAALLPNMPSTTRHGRPPGHILEERDALRATRAADQGL